MSFSVLNLLTSYDKSSTGLNSYGFRQFIESFIPNLRSSTRARTVLMTPTDSVKFKGDLSGWLLTQGVKYDYHWIIARLNGFLDCAVYDGNKLAFIMPSIGEVDSILIKYKNSL